MKLEKKVSTMTTTVIGTESNTYEIIREIKGMEDGEEAYIIQLYPTVSIQSAERIDSTAQHLINKMLEMKWKKVHLLNLYSMVAHQKPKAGDLKNVDKENLAYIRKILSSADAKAKVIIGWGNSLQSNKSANESKLVLLEGLAGVQGKRKLWQIVTDGMDIELTGTHILFLGLRYAGCVWTLTEYPAKTEMDKLTKALVKSAGKAKKEIKKKEEVQEEVKNDVSEDCKQAGS
jgi:Protein of unknown function (DUF1643).